MGESIAATFMAYVNFLSIILLTVMCGVGYSYFKQDIFFTNCDINHKVFFGCGIGVGIILFFLNFWVYVDPIFLSSLITIPGFIVIVCIFITYTTPKEKDVCISKHQNKWYSQQTGFYNFQIHYQCCGWTNSSDHGIELCPSTFESSCRDVLNNYIEPRMDRLLTGACMVLVFMVISYVALFVISYIELESDFCALMFSFF